MAKYKKSEQSDTLRDLDLFAEPVQLKFNSKSTYKTTVGGCVSIIFLIVSTFIIAAFLKSLIVGFDFNAVLAAYDLTLSELES